MAINWVFFQQGGVSAELGGAVCHYRVEACTPVRGAAPDIALGSTLTRIDTAGALPEAPADGLQFRGIVQHQNYTAGVQRAELDSIGPFAGRDDILCVLIPIHKTAEWWQLPADVRTAHFHNGGAHHQHAAVGAPYVKRIHRRLFHSRYHGGADAPIPYDFLTYFEFPDAERGAFEELLAGLRDERRNPEWAYVDGEFEIWMRRLA